MVGASLVVGLLFLAAAFGLGYAFGWRTRGDRERGRRNGFVDLTGPPR